MVVSVLYARRLRQRNKQYLDSMSSSDVFFISMVMTETYFCVSNVPIFLFCALLKKHCVDSAIFFLEYVLKNFILGGCLNGRLLWTNIYQRPYDGPFKFIKNCEKCFTLHSAKHYDNVSNDSRKLPLHGALMPQTLQNQPCYTVIQKTLSTFAHPSKNE